MDTKQLEAQTGLKFDKITLCFNCPSTATIQPTADIRAMSPAYRACPHCVGTKGVHHLRRLADAAQAAVVTVKEYGHKMRCEMCGAPRFDMPPKGIYCDTCRGEYRAKFGKECPV